MKFLGQKGGPTVGSDEIFRQAGRLLLANLGNAGWAVGGYFLVALALLAVPAVTVKVSGNAWPAVLADLLILVLLVVPLARLTLCHLALNIWDDGEASLIEALTYARGNYLAALSMAWRGLLYEGELWLRFLACMLPGAALGSMFYFIPPHLGYQVDLDWIILGAVLLTIGLALYYLWGQARRVATFLYSFNAFEDIEGESAFGADIVEKRFGFWRSRFARMYHHLDREPFSGALNRPLAVIVFVGLIWGGLAALIVSYRMPPLATAYVLGLGPLGIRFLASFWYTIVAAGYFRAYLVPGTVFGRR